MRAEGITSPVGQKFGQMTILEELPRRYSKRMVMCQCECGKKKVAGLGDLQRGQTVSCGCWKRNPRPKKPTGEALAGQAR